MGDMVDSVNPANIGPEHNGELAARITVLADEAGQVFDLESGNAGATACGQAIGARFGRGDWSVFYVNETTEPDATQAVAAEGVPLLGVESWPAAGCYLWCTDPSGNIAAGRWRPPVAPVAVQDRFPGPVDWSTTFGAWPFTVAGYIDGVDSKWPADAWARFTSLVHIPTEQPPEVPDVQVIERGTETHIVDRNPDGSLAHWWRDNAIPEGQPGYGWHYESVPNTPH